MNTDKALPPLSVFIRVHLWLKQFMPELPEVEVTRRKLAPSLLGRMIAAVHTTKPSYFFLTRPTVLKRRLKGRTVRELQRHGKYLLAELEDGSRLLLHLGMTGQLFVQGSASLRLLAASKRGQSLFSPGKTKRESKVGRGENRDCPPVLTPEQQPAFKPDKHTHLRLAFVDGGPEVWFRDARKFGKVKWMARGESDARLEMLGPDALEATGEVLHDATRRRSVSVKALLLDQNVLAGVGNIYADEALFLSGIRPTRKAAKLTRAECDKLAANIRKVLNRSIDTGGSSISDYVNPDGQDGAYQDERHVYARTGEPCKACGTPIKRVVIGQRSAHYCPACQS